MNRVRVDLHLSILILVRGNLVGIVVGEDETRGIGDDDGDGGQNETFVRITKTPHVDSEGSTTALEFPEPT